ncbi:MAG TPA: amidohydrolase family protein [Xanthobacteraceae bacterium]|nr:amidohydrolase family protein [Xanthobacteraceae bacterium]
MARKNLKQRGLSRRRFMQSAAAMAASGTLLASAARAAKEHESKEHDSREHHSREHHSECEGSRDLNLVNGRFLTLDAHNSVVSAIGIRDGRIVEVGRGGALGPCGRTINLKGATVIPGLIDSHVHFIRCGQNPGHEVRIIETAASVGELQQMISARIRELNVPAGEFITCVGGWNINGLAEKRLPTLAELDAAAPNHAVYLSTTGAGGAVTNSVGKAFFESRGVTVTINAGGAATLNAGQAFAALQAVQTDADRQRGTAEAVDFASSLGLTMVTDMGTQGAAVEYVDGYKYMMNLWREGNLNIRLRSFLNSSFDTGFVAAQSVVTYSFPRHGDDVFRSNGVGERVNSSTTNPGYVDLVKFAASKGWMVTQHSLTSTEISFHISAYQQAKAVAAIDKLRWTLDHVNPISDDQIAAVRDLGIGLRLQGWNYTSAAPAGPPWRKLVDAGIPLSAGTDSTNVGPFNPWLMISYMTTMKNNAGTAATPANQQISRLEALRMYTNGGAFHSFDDDKLGSIEVGKLADLAVLSDDPLSVSDDKLKRLRSVLTLQAGRIVHGEADD